MKRPCQNFQINSSIGIDPSINLGSKDFPIIIDENFESLEEVTIIDPSSLTIDNYLEPQELAYMKWKFDPKRMLQVVPKTKKRKKEKIVYEPCTWSEFIKKTNTMVNEKKAKKEKKAMTKFARAMEDVEEKSTMAKHILAIQQAQIAMYGEYIDDAQFTKWD